MKILNKKAMSILLFALISAQVFSGCSEQGTSENTNTGGNSIVVENPAPNTSVNSDVVSLRPDLTTATTPPEVTEPENTVDTEKYPEDEYFYEKLGNGENPEIIPVKYSDAKSIDGDYYYFDTAYICQYTSFPTLPSGNSVDNPELFNEALNGYSEDVKKGIEYDKFDGEYIKLTAGDVYGKNNMKVTEVIKKVKKNASDGSILARPVSTTIAFEGTATIKGYVTDYEDEGEVWFSPIVDSAKDILPITGYGAHSVKYNSGGIAVGNVASFSYYLGKSGEFDSSKWGNDKVIEAEVTITNPTYIDVWDTSDQKELCYLAEKAEVVNVINVIERKGE